MASKAERILITGSGGMLGSDVLNQFKTENYELLATDLSPVDPHLKTLDVREKEQCAEVFNSFRPDIVVHLAALTDLEFCENNPSACYLTNVTGTKNIVELCKVYGSTIVHISSASIFDGSRNIYREQDAANPLNVYGKSKFDSEQIVLAELKKSIVLRAGWMMGGGVNKDKKFIGKLYHQIIQGERDIYAVTDKWGTPTYTKSLAKSIRTLCESNLHGTFHHTCSGVCTRFEMATKFVGLLGLSKQITVHPVDSSFFDSNYSTKRPIHESLDNQRLVELSHDITDGWEACLEDYAHDFSTDLARHL